MFTLTTLKKQIKRLLSHVITRCFTCPLTLTGRTGWRKRPPYWSLPEFSCVLSVVAGVPFLHCNDSALSSLCFQCCFYPPCVPHLSSFFHPLCSESKRERGKVWVEQLVALATLSVTAADWNRNWPIHVSLQAGSGPCLVLTDYLISIQTAQVSAPLLRSLEKRPQPASFWKPPEPSTLLPFPVLITYSFVPLLFFSSFPPPLVSPSSSLDPSFTPFLLSVSHSRAFLEFEVCCECRPWFSPIAITSQHCPPFPFRRLSTWKGILCFRCKKVPVLSTGRIHQGLWKTYPELQLQFQWKERGARRGGWTREWGRQLEGITAQFHRQHNYSHTKYWPSIDSPEEHNTIDAFCFVVVSIALIWNFKVLNEQKQCKSKEEEILSATMGHINRMGTSTGLLLPCAGSSYWVRALRRDQQRVTLYVAKSDTGFHMMGGEIFASSLLPLSLLLSHCSK